MIFVGASFASNCIGGSSSGGGSDSGGGGTTPSISVASPVITISESDGITITCSTLGATIRYTTDGTLPSTTNGSIYGASFFPSESCTIKAIAYLNGTTSSITSKTYTKADDTEPDDGNLNKNVVLGFYSSGNGAFWADGMAYDGSTISGWATTGKMPVVASKSIKIEGLEGKVGIVKFGTDGKFTSGGREVLTSPYTMDGFDGYLAINVTTSSSSNPSSSTAVISVETLQNAIVIQE